MTDQVIEGLNIRKEPNSRSAILGLLLRGTSIDVGEHSPYNNWRTYGVLHWNHSGAKAKADLPHGSLTGN